MSSDKDTTSTLYPGVSGTKVDESNILEPDFTTGAKPTSVGKRPRVVVSGELARAVHPEASRKDRRVELPVIDVELRKLLNTILVARLRREELLERVVRRAVGR